MRVAKGRVASSEHLFGSTYLTWFVAPTIAQGAHPGQFLMFRIERSTDPLLPRPMSYHRLRPGPDGTEVGVLYQVWGQGTALLSRLNAGEEVLLWGPLGRGFDVKKGSRNLLLIAGGMGTAPLVWLAEDSVAKGKNVTLLLGARSAELTLPAKFFPAQVEIVIVTEDGSAGRQGFVTDALAEYLPWADQVFACGPNRMYESLARVVRGLHSRTPVQVLLETNMACGTGLCYGCAVETRRGVKQVCRDGPRFELRDVF